MGKILTVDNLKTYYQTSKGFVKAVDGISFDLDQGETLGIVGESGCGKSTTGFSLLKMIPSNASISGKIIIDSQDIVSLNENQVRKNIRWEKISMIFQGAMNCLTPVYTIGKQMMETLREHNDEEMNAAEANKRINKYLNLVGLSSDISKRYPHELSGGMKQRVVIATALFLESNVVVCDEPTTALDVVVQAQIINLLKDLKEKLNLSFIFITHDLATEAEVANRIAVMYAGKIVEIGTNAQVYGGKSKHPYTQMLLKATPRLHEKVEELAFIPGTPPDLVDPPMGCRFHPRCPYAIDKCKKEEPQLLEIESDHKVACWRWEYV